MSAGYDDAAYKRFQKAFTVPAGGGKLHLWTSFDLEADYDYMFVEIHTVSQDDWTTLEDDERAHVRRLGLSCTSGGDGSDWQSSHPFLAHYQTKTDTGKTAPDRLERRVERRDRQLRRLAGVVDADSRRLSRSKCRDLDQRCQ